MTVKVAVVYYSATGSVAALAQAVAEGAASAGAEVRLRRVADLAPAGAIDRNPQWRAHVDAAAAITEASIEDLEWADAFAFGTPTRFGTPSAELKHFIDGTVGLWQDGGLVDKPVTAFTSAYHRHGGHEATVLSLSNVFYHWGSVMVPPGYTDPAVYAAGGNPYGTTTVSSATDQGPDDSALAAARHQGRRLTVITARLLGSGVAGPEVDADDESRAGREKSLQTA